MCSIIGSLLKIGSFILYVTLTYLLVSYVLASARPLAYLLECSMACSPFSLLARIVYNLLLRCNLCIKELNYYL